MNKAYIFGKSRHDIVPLSPTPGDVSGVESFSWRETIHPGGMEEFEFLEPGAKRDFPQGGHIEVIKFGGWRNWQNGLFHSTLQAIGVTLKPGATLTGPVCFKEIESNAQATSPTSKRSVGDQYVLPILGIAATIATFVFAEESFYGFCVGAFAALFTMFSLEDRKREKIPGEVAKHGRFRVLGPVRKSWN